MIVPRNRQRTNRLRHESLDTYVISNLMPALTPAEWAGVLAKRANLEAIRDQFLDTPFSPHAVAALLLYEQPFGFSAQDVEDETQVAAYCDVMAGENELAGKSAEAATFRMLGGRHQERAERIAALLPPMGPVEMPAR
ncbi:MAG: hypothetical protein H7Z74_02160 [Anaerolineae bacterium]|nr:hypothetical protein [Gemmatimonadaceae bacterium]